MRGVIAFAAVLALAWPAPAGSPARLSVDREQALVTYVAGLGRSELSGVSRFLIADVEELPGGDLRVAARVPVRSFESGNAMVDALFRRALDADRYPEVEFRGQAKARAGRGQFAVQLEGTITVHGVARPISVPVQVVREKGLVFVKAAFPVDLDAFGVPAPRLGALEVGRRVQIELHALLAPVAEVASRG